MIEAIKNLYLSEKEMEKICNVKERCVVDSCLKDFFPSRDH